jgi:hypothetical protein
MSRAAGILLIDPKYPHDVGGVQRAADGGHPRRLARPLER